MTSAPGKVGILIRVQEWVADGVRHRVAADGVSINRYLEQLVQSDLNAVGRNDAEFAVLPLLKFPSKGKNGAGRPTRGPRHALLLRIDTAVRERIHNRAADLGLTTTNYLESLVSQDISAAAGTGEEMTLVQTA